MAVRAGDLAEAKARYAEGLVIRSKLAQNNPSSAEAQRDVSVSLNNLGDVAVRAGDLAEAKARFVEGLVIDRKLAKDNPSSAEAQRDLLLSLAKLGVVTGDRGLLREALEIARELDRTGRLAPRDRKMLDVIPEAINSIP